MREGNQWKGKQKGDDSVPGEGDGKQKEEYAGSSSEGQIAK